mgnify:CR=1 FL=1
MSVLILALSARSATVSGVVSLASLGVEYVASSLRYDDAENLRVTEQFADGCDQSEPNWAGHPPLSATR